MSPVVAVVLIIGGYALFLIGLAALSEQVVIWWEHVKFDRHVKQAMALLNEDER